MNTNLKEHSTQLTELPVKLKLNLYVEVVVAALIEQGKLNPDTLYIKPQGTFSRNYQHDLSKVYLIEKNHGEKTNVFFNINREGLYDMLPEGIFHKNLSKTKHINTEESVKELKMHKEEEKSARKFFLPLEQMFYQQRIDIEIEEQKSLIGLSEAIVEELITDFWNVPVSLDYYQSLCLVYMLPIMHNIVGNFELIGQCFSILLQTPVAIRRTSTYYEKVNLKENQLGNFVLGDNMLLGDYFFSELDQVKIIIGPLSKNTILDFLPQGHYEAYLCFLAGYFMPAELDWELEILPKQEEETFQLGDNSEKGLLNYTTVI